MVIVLLGLILIALLFPGFLRWVLAIIALAFCAAIIAGGAKAQDAKIEIPKYDVDTLCAHVGGVPLKRCIAMAQEAYNTTVEIWPNLGISEKKICLDRVNRAMSPEFYTPNPYSILGQCAEQQLSLKIHREDDLPDHFRP